MNKRITIIYVSRSGNTEQMVQAAAEGARSAGAEVRIKEAAEATGADIEECDALIWGTGNYYGYMHGRLKDWFDREHVRLRKKATAGELKPRPYLCCLSASANPYRQLPTVERLSATMNLKKAFEAVTSKGKPTEEVLAACRSRGADLVTLDTTAMKDLYKPPAPSALGNTAEMWRKPTILVVMPESGCDTTKALNVVKEHLPEYEIKVISCADLVKE
jgi:flavodoxin I